MVDSPTSWVHLFNSRIRLSIFKSMIFLKTLLKQSLSLFAPSFPAVLLGATRNSNIKYWCHLGDVLHWLSVLAGNFHIVLGSLTSPPPKILACHENTVLASCGMSSWEIQAVEAQQSLPLGQEGSLLSGRDVLFLKECLLFLQVSTSLFRPYCSPLSPPDITVVVLTTYTFSARFHVLN